MASDPRSAETLRDYLRTLKADARALLAAEIERAALRGERMPAADLILEELRKLSPVSAAGAVSPEQLFFAPIEPFLIDGNPDRKHCGRIVRSSLAPLWRWICRDLAPQDAAVYADQVVVAFADGNRSAVDQIVSAFQDRVCSAIRQRLDAVASHDKARRRLAAQIGTPRGVDEAGEIAGILQARDQVALLRVRLPASITNFADEQLENVKFLLDNLPQRHSELFTCAIILVMTRLASRSQLIRLAIRAAGTDEAERVAQSSYAIAFTAVLSEMEALVWRLRMAIKAAAIKQIGGLLKDIHDTARGLRTEINLSPDCDWARQLAVFRAEVSELIESQIDSIPGKVRRLLRLRPANEIAQNSTLDPIDVEEVEAAIELVSLCRSYAHELAVNEVTLKIQSELEALLDGATSAVLEAYRGAGASEVRFRSSQVDAAVRFAAKVFGTGYASLLAKAAEVARSDRKPAKA
jgi:hypothetical protein